MSKSRSYKPDWSHTNVPWEEKLIIWDWAAKSEKIENISRCLNEMEIDLHRDTIRAVIDELRELESAMSNLLAPHIQAYRDHLRSASEDIDGALIDSEGSHELTGDRLPDSELFDALGLWRLGHLQQMLDLSDRLCAEVNVPDPWRATSVVAPQSLGVDFEMGPADTSHYWEFRRGSELPSLPVESEAGFPLLVEHFTASAQEEILNAVRGKTARYFDLIGDLLQAIMWETTSRHQISLSVQQVQYGSVTPGFVSTLYQALLYHAEGRPLPPLAYDGVPRGPTSPFGDPPVRSSYWTPIPKNEPLRIGNTLIAMAPGRRLPAIHSTHSEIRTGTVASLDARPIVEGFVELGAFATNARAELTRPLVSRVLVESECTGCRD